jgi:hypothetical protein
VGVIGLGTGTLAAYGQTGQHWTFYEIDPAIVRLAQDPHHFTYLQDSPATIDIELGDARMTLARTPPQGYDLFIVDAFSSDAIPVHLITREAIQLYLTHLKDGGVIAFHMSNRYLDLRPLVSELASDAGVVLRVEEDIRLTREQSAEGKSASRWAIMARKPEDLGLLIRDSRWHAIPKPGSEQSLLWTDDFSNLLTLFRWRGAAADLQ